VSVATAGLIGAGGLPGPAAAAPVNQPSNGANCHGASLAQFASAEPQGVGNTVGGQGVQTLQLAIKAQCASP